MTNQKINLATTMKKIGMFLLLLVAGSLATGCKGINDLESDITDLKGRVLKLESWVKYLNENVESLRKLCEEGTTISKVEHGDGTYTLTLSDGSKLSLVETLSITVPLVGISDAGNWEVSYDNGASFREIEVNGLPVPATGQDGITPKFRISSTGYWEVSYDDGMNYESVKDENGNPVRAGGEASDSEFFTSIVPKEDALVVTLKSGLELNIPIVKDFYCYFDKSLTGVQTVVAGATAEFDLYVKGAEVLTVVSAPEAWTVEIGEPDAQYCAKVRVAAPSSATRATANNSRDIAILAIKGTFSQLAKIQVEAQQVALDSKSRFEAGQLTVGDETLDASSYAAELITAESAEQSVDLTERIKSVSVPTVFFLDGPGVFTLSGSTTINQPVVLIGQYADQRPVVTFGNNAYFSCKSGALQLKYLNIQARNGYLFNNSGSEPLFTHLTIDACKVTGIRDALFYTSKTSVGIGSIRFQSSVFEFENTKSIAFFNIGATANPSVFGSLYLENNLLYHKTTVERFQLMGWNFDTATSDDTPIEVMVRNNSFVNLRGTNIFLVLNRANVVYERNIFCVTLDSSYSSYLYKLKSGSSTATVTDNILYDAGVNWAISASGSAIVPEKNSLPKVADNPFTMIDTSSGIFRKSAQYADYGSDIEQM